MTICIKRFYLCIFIFLILLNSDCWGQIVEVECKEFGNKKKIALHLQKEGNWDDKNPIWSPLGNYVSFERIGRGRKSFQGIYCFKVGSYEPFLLSKQIEIKKTSGFLRNKGYYRKSLSFLKDRFKDRYASYFCWSKSDGRYFIYTENLNLYIGNVEGEKVKKSLFLKLKNSKGEICANRYSDWSVLNNIVFLSSITGGGDLYLCSSKDLNSPPKIVRLTRTSTIDTNPCWSPDGKQIVYSSLQDGTLDLYLIPNYRKPKSYRLTNLSTEEVNPRWSPDGRYIAFYTIKEDELDETTSSLMVYDIEEKALKEIAKNVLRDEKKGPCWLPKEAGKVLIYISQYGNQLFLYDVEANKNITVPVKEKVISDVHSNPAYCKKIKNSTHVIIAYSAQNKQGRKRIYLKKIILKR